MTYFENLIKEIPKTEHSPTLERNLKGEYIDEITNTLMSFFAQGGQCALEFQEVMEKAKKLSKQETKQ